MRCSVLLTLAILPGVLSAQHVGVLNPSRGMPAPSGAYRYGNILFPGGTPPAINNSHAGRLGSTIAGYPPYTGVAPGIGRGGVRPGYPGGRGRTIAVPYAVPFIYGGGYGYGYYADPQPSNVTVVVPQQPTPQVIINNTYGGAEPPATSTRSELREYSGDTTDPSIRIYEGSKPRATDVAVRSTRSIMDEKPTIYLIALRDGTIRQAIGYWVKDDALHYVTPESSVNHVSLGMVDGDRSTELNAERKIEFDLKLPH